MSNTLTLNPSGTNGCTPDQDPWTPANGAEVTIINSSGYRQTLSSITNGCLIQTRGGRVNSITLDHNGDWTGRAGGIGNRGTYQYDDGGPSPMLDMRSGTIDPS